MLTSVSDANKQISGLKFGADDYVVKPFSPKELIMRINAILSRYQAKGPKTSTNNRSSGRKGDNYN